MTTATAIKPGARVQLPDDEFSTCAYWTVEELDGSYWSVTLDCVEAVYSAKRYKPRKDGDGEDVIEVLGDVEARGLAMMRGLYRSHRVR